MKYLLLLISIASMISCTSTPRDPAAEDSSLENYVKLADTPHFKIFQINEDVKLSQNEILALNETLESSFTKIASFLQRESPQQKISVYLEGDGFKDTSNPRYPNVELDASMHLYRYPENLYKQGIQHELVHIFRIEIIREHSRLGDHDGKFGFIEEAFAEFVALNIGATPTNLNPKKHDLSLSSLFRNHEKVPEYDTNSFATRASFFKYLEETYGREKVFELAYNEDLISESMFEKIFTRSFLNLSSAWQVWDTRTALQ